MNHLTREDTLIQIMNNGFKKAASSFSLLIKKPVLVATAQSTTDAPAQELLGSSSDPEELVVLVTQIIGEICGKSFLILHQQGNQEIFRAINNAVLNQPLQEAFLLEIDNIISAAVIAELSNELGLEIYGDVPQLVKINSRDLQEYIQHETGSDHSERMIFNTTTFHWGSDDAIQSPFIWKLTSKIFDFIHEPKLTA